MLDPEPSGVVALTKAARDAMTPDDILERAKAGNRRFREGRTIERDFLAEQRATAAGQYPAAVLLGCIDSRSPAEIIFNVGLGDIFNCRVAGNVENDDVLASLEFATALAGAKLVVVLGHSGCSAVKGAIDAGDRGEGPARSPRPRPPPPAPPEDPPRRGGHRLRRGADVPEPGVRERRLPEEHPAHDREHPAEEPGDRRARELRRRPDRGGVPR